MTKWKIYNEDAVEWAKNYQKGKFHALLTDAPYHLTSITKRFGKNGSAPAKFGSDGAFQRASKGFMGTQWDGGDIAFRPETWEAFKEVLYPGAFGMAFSASRNWHRMAVAIEGLVALHPNPLIQQADILAMARDKKDWNMVKEVEDWMREQANFQEDIQSAGFIIHPTMFFLWVQGQGFPKATNISKQLNGDGKAWEGHRYGLQALKPSVEPIIVFQKPYEGKPLDNIVSTGAGALNIDGGRIPLATDDEYTINTFDDGAKPFGNGAGHKYSSRPVKWTSPRGGIWKTDKEAKGELVESNQGRWPSNLILDETSAEKLDMQTGQLVSGKPSGTRKAKNNIYGQYAPGLPVEGFGDAGGASRFFYQVSTQLDDADPFYYCAKVSPKERNAGLEEMPETLGGSLDGGNDTRNGKNKPQLHPTKNNHPTLKPIALAKYLATLLLPPVDYAPRRIFIPFSGSGSEMVGCGLAGWEHVVGVEFDTENGYVDIAKKRLEHWLKGT